MNCCTVHLLIRSTYINTFLHTTAEYVSAEKIENVINQSMLIGQSFVHGDSYQTYLVAIVVPDEEPVRAWAKSNIPDTANSPISELCKSDKLKHAILLEIRRLSKANGLHGFETVKASRIKDAGYGLFHDGAHELKEGDIANVLLTKQDPSGVLDIDNFQVSQPAPPPNMQGGEAKLNTNALR